MFPKAPGMAKCSGNFAPLEDELILPKTATNVFISTPLDYILRNLGVTHLIVSGLLTDQCVESAVRDACDLGYLVTLVTDACATYTPEQHEYALKARKGALMTIHHLDDTQSHAFGDNSHPAYLDIQSEE